MTDFESSMNDLENQSNEAAADADKELEKELTALIAAVHTNLDDIKPKVTDQATYDKLIKVVTEATQKNENLSQIVSRVKSLGEGAISLVGKISNLLKV